MIFIAGKNNIAVHALESLSQYYGSQNIVALANENDTDKDYWQRSLKKRAIELNVKMTTLSKLQVTTDDVFLSLEFDKIIQADIFNKCRAYNFHFSDLPKYKGMYTSIWPILNGDTTSAVTLHNIDHGIDTGNIYKKKTFNISKNDRAQDLYKKYIKNCIYLFDTSIENIISGKLKSYRQQKEFSSYFSKSSIDFDNVHIDFDNTAWSIQRYVYAFSFRVYQLPIAFNRYVVEIDILDNKSRSRPGHIIQETEDYIDVATIDFDVRLFFDKLDQNLPKFGNLSRNELPNLLNGMCGVNDNNAKGWSPIIVAAYYGNIEMVDALIANYADVNDTNINGTSVLMYAKNYCCKVQNKELFDYLLSKGANLNHRDHSNKSLLDYMTIEETNFLNI